MVVDCFRRFGLGILPLALIACGQGPDHAPAAAMTTPPTMSDDLNVDGDTDMQACVGTQVSADTLPVDLFAVVDGSASMQEATASGVSKWYATKAAFREFLEHAPAGMGFGLSLFPSPGEDVASCSTDSYRSAALPITDVTTMAKSALERLDTVTPQGQTPTAPAYTAALDLATAYALSHPDRSVVVVLATDGLPTTCAPTDVPALAQLAKGALEGPAHVRTLVVISKALSGADTGGFERVAAAGGTQHALPIDPRGDFAGQFAGALGAAATRQVACDLALPEPPDGQHLDYDAVNVVLDGSSRVTLPRVAGATSCDARGGWYYDVEPSTGAPSRLNVCRASCDRAATNGTSSLRVELGCKTKTLVR
jgi:hypothetical protein